MHYLENTGSNNIYMYLYTYKAHQLLFKTLVYATWGHITRGQLLLPLSVATDVSCGLQWSSSLQKSAECWNLQNMKHSACIANAEIPVVWQIDCHLSAAAVKTTVVLTVVKHLCLVPQALELGRSGNQPFTFLAQADHLPHFYMLKWILISPFIVSTIHFFVQSIQKPKEQAITVCNFQFLRPGMIKPHFNPVRHTIRYGRLTCTQKLTRWQA